MDKEYALEHGLLVMNKAGTPYEIPTGNLKALIFRISQMKKRRSFGFKKENTCQILAWMDSRRTVESSFIPKK